MIKSLLIAILFVAGLLALAIVLITLLPYGNLALYGVAGLILFFWLIIWMVWK